MEHTIKCIERLSSKLDELQKSICDGIDEIFRKYAHKFNEVSEPINEIPDSKEDCGNDEIYELCLKKSEIQAKVQIDSTLPEEQQQNYIESCKTSIRKENSLNKIFYNIKLQWVQLFEKFRWCEKHRLKVKWKE